MASVLIEIDKTNTGTAGQSGKAVNTMPQTSQSSGGSRTGGGIFKKTKKTIKDKITGAAKIIQSAPVAEQPTGNPETENKKKSLPWGWIVAGLGLGAVLLFSGDKKSKKKK